ncbi:flippase-like domain-containing protein [Roseibium sp. CAU 1637]|uniref:Flippase-like domain-containing protein n=1 Tax=Roseibium limicola TaxID=2816037 RepID=A0A939J7L4_9HYPH|nr:flippase-like domain-containing protein [Roseibium limicola]
MSLLKLGVLPIALSLGLLAAIAAFVDIGAVWTALSAVSIRALGAAFVVVQLQILLSALRWRFTARRLNLDLPLGEALHEYYIGSSLNQILPGGVAGDVVRAYRQRQAGPSGWKRPASAIVLERVSGQLAFVLLIGLGLFAWPLVLAERLPVGATEIALIVAGFLSVASGACFAVFRKSTSSRLSGMREDLLEVFWHRKALAVQVGLSSLIVLTYVMTFAIASHAVGAPLSVIACITIVPLSLLTMLIPASVGGWGTREMAAAALWPIFGYSPEQGVAASLLYGIFSLVSGGFPALVLMICDVWRGRLGKT